MFLVLKLHTSSMAEFFRTFLTRLQQCRNISKPPTLAPVQTLPRTEWTSVPSPWGSVCQDLSYHSADKPSPRPSWWGSCTGSVSTACKYLLRVLNKLNNGLVKKPLGKCWTWLRVDKTIPLFMAMFLNISWWLCGFTFILEILSTNYTTIMHTNVSNISTHYRDSSTRDIGAGSTIWRPLKTDHCIM